MWHDVLHITDEQLRSRPKEITRRFAIWLTVCAICAAPGIIWAAMVKVSNFVPIGIAIVLIATLSTIITSQVSVARWAKSRRLASAIGITYFSRIIISIVAPFGMVADMLPGLFASEISGFKPEHSNDFATILFCTLFTAVGIHIVLFAYFVIVYVLAVMFMARWEPEPTQRGFEVLPLDNGGQR